MARGMFHSECLTMFLLRVRNMVIDLCLMPRLKMLAAVTTWCVCMLAVSFSVFPGSDVGPQFMVILTCCIFTLNSYLGYAHTGARRKENILRVNSCVAWHTDPHRM